MTKAIIDGYTVTTYDDGTVCRELISSVYVPSFEQNKQQKLQSLNQWHDSKTAEMKAKYSQSEVDSFLDKRNESLDYKKDNTAKTPYIDAMAGYDPTIRLQLINSILAKVEAVAMLEAYVLLKRDTIEACTTQAELDAIVW